MDYRKSWLKKLQVIAAQEPGLNIDENERVLIAKALIRTNGVVKHAITLLKISEPTIHRKIAKYGLGLKVKNES